MKNFFLFIALSLPAVPATAQNIATAAQSGSQPVAQEAPDTVAAIHRLFAAKRHQSALVIGSTVGVGLLSFFVAEGTRHSYTIDATPVIATGISLLSIPATITEIGYYRRFTRRKEQRAIAAFEAHKLPEAIRLRLQPAYFKAGRAGGK